MDSELITLLRDRLSALRGRRARPTEVALSQVKDEFPGSLRHGRYPVELDAVAASEFEHRADSLISFLRERLAELGVPWSRANGQQIEKLVIQELQADFDELYRRLGDLTRASGGPRIGELTKAHDGSRASLISEVKLLVHREERHRVPLEEQLASPRYIGVRRSWQKSREFLVNGTPDYENAPKEAISAVEQLARLVVDRPAATLGEAIGDLRRRGDIQAPLLRGIEGLWGWTSSTDGVRHGAAATPIDAASARLVCGQAEAVLLFLLEKDVPDR